MLAPQFSATSTLLKKSLCQLTFSNGLAISVFCRGRKTIGLISVLAPLQCVERTLKMV